MSKKLKNVRFKQTVKVGGPGERSTVNAGQDGIKALEFVNDPDMGHGVLLVSRTDRLIFVPTSNVNEVELEDVTPVLAPEKRAK